MGYFAMLGISYTLQEMAIATAMEKRRNILRAIFIQKIKGDCPHCEHWHNQEMECCWCDATPKLTKAVATEKVTVQ